MLKWTLREALRLIEDGEITPSEAFEAYASAIERQEATVRAFEHLDIEQARRGLGARTELPLRGLPVAVKDLFDTADMPTTYGSPIYAGWRPKADSAIVARLRALGASIPGKTVTTEFANRHPGPTRNPHDLERTPGGSSSGSAAAVACGMAPFGIGSQTAGSTIRPAAFCGVVGFKPSWGLLPLEGAKTVSWSLDTVGLFGRTMTDCVFAFHLLRGTPGAKADEPAPDRQIRIGVYRTPHWNEVEPESKAAFDAAADRLATAGAAVSEIAPLSVFDRLDEVHSDIMGYETAASFGWEEANAAELFSADFAALLELGHQVTPERHASALAARDNARRAMARLRSDVDLLLTPSAPGFAPDGLDFTGSPLFNRLWTAVGAPAANLPVPSPIAAPLGVQLVGFQNRDAIFVKRAIAIERMLDGAAA